MTGSLVGKKALITGGTRGIGRAIANRFAQEGASLIIFGTNEEKGREVASELSSQAIEGQKISFLKVDVRKGQEVDEGMKRVLEEFGAIDILVNNAGVTRDNLLMRMTEEEWDEVNQVNLKALYHTCKAVIRHMMKARSGKIINITSVVGLMGNAGQTNYAASKAGMIGFTQSLAKEVGSRGICCNCIAPGFITTDMTDKLATEQKEALLKQIPLQRFGQPEEIAEAALFLACAHYVTGQVVTVDGGMTT